MPHSWEMGRSDPNDPSPLRSWAKMDQVISVHFYSNMLLASLAGLWTSYFWLLCVSHLKRRDSFFYLKKPFLENGLESSLIFVFILKGKTK